MVERLRRLLPESARYPKSFLDRPRTLTPAHTHTPRIFASTPIPAPFRIYISVSRAKEGVHTVTHIYYFLRDYEIAFSAYARESGVYSGEKPETFQGYRVYLGKVFAAVCPRIRTKSEIPRGDNERTSLFDIPTVTR